MNPEEQPSSKKTLWIGLGIFFFLLLAGGLVWYFWGGGNTGGVTKLFPFSPSSGEDVPQTDTDRHEIGGDSNGDSGLVAADRLFRQLSLKPVAGAYALKRDGEQYVRFIEKETGHAYEIPLAGGVAEQLTNTTIPRIAIADWALGGNAVLLRYLEEDRYTGRETIKTHLARLNLSSALSSDDVGGLTLDFLPDNIVALSVSPDGKSLFYIIKKDGAAVGSVVNVATKATKEVFRSPFTEWLPQFLNNGSILFSTKPSGAVPGYSYVYDPKTKALNRLVREKDGLTALANASGSRVLYGENVAGNAILNSYDPKGFPGDEGTVFYENIIPINTLPEKCAWLSDNMRVLCGAFNLTPTGLIPDLWYQGRISFNDTFWLANTTSGDVTYLSDPKEETGQTFDVANPLLSEDGAYFIFTNKKDGMLWSMRLPQQVGPETSDTIPEGLSPEELKDAQGSLQAPQ